MKVFINAPSVKEGGSRVVLTRLLAAMQSLRPDVAWHVAAPPDVLADVGGGLAEAIPVSLDGSLSVPRWYEWTLPAMLQSRKVDVLFSITNYLPRRPVCCATLLLEQHAGHFSREFERLLGKASSSPLSGLLWRVKRSWVWHSVRSANGVTVQTKALADAIAERGVRAPHDISVIPHGNGLMAERAQPRPISKGASIRIGYIGKWGIQKNFHTLFSAVRMLRERGRAVRLVLTLPPQQQAVVKLMASADGLAIADLIENHGETGVSDEGAAKLCALYDSLDIFVFASVCESFGMPMVEAMSRGLPIIVASTAENREIVGNAGIQYPPYDAAALARQLEILMENPQMRSELSARSIARSREFSWKESALRTLIALDQAVQAYER